MKTFLQSGPAWHGHPAHDPSPWHGRLAHGSRVGLLLLAFFALIAPARAQVRPYIGYAYPAGGKQGTTFQVKLGGQGLDEINQALVTGAGVTARIVDYARVLNNQEITLLTEQIKELKQTNKESATASAMMSETMMAGDAMMSEAAAGTNATPHELLAQLERRVNETVSRPASAALANIVLVEVTIAADAPPGRRELRLATSRGVSNPLVFHVGELPEYTRKPMVTAQLQVLGKEAQALRKRPENEVEDRIEIPCTVNGQIASGELNRYRFTARQGQSLVLTTQARALIPFIADAVPGWFQPVLVLYDADGKEVAYDDDFRFKPDPTIIYRVPRDGEYTFVIYDAIYRGREDFVYRVTVGEVPFVTSIFPLGCRAGETPRVQMQGVNLEHCQPALPAKNAGPGTYPVFAEGGKTLSNPLPFAVDTLPEISEQEPNDRPGQSQKIALPVIINGRIGRPDDTDVFQFTGKSNQVIVASVSARRLDSPLDSFLKLTDAKGNLVAFNDDCEDSMAGINTHDADSYFKVRLPADGIYCVHLGDTARKGGDEYAYRLRLSEPQPDFALRLVPSSLALRPKGNASVAVHLLRREGFEAPVSVALKNPPPGFSSVPLFLTGTQTVARLTIKTTLPATPEPFALSVEGLATVDGKDIRHEAVPAEDRMQAFLWRHLVPASDFKVLVFDPSYKTPKKRTAPPLPASLAETKPVATTNAVATNLVSTNLVALTRTNAPENKAKFNKQQLAGRLRQLRVLYEEGLLTDSFYSAKIAECEALQ